MSEIIKVSEAKYIDKYRLEILFSDGTVKELDFERSFKKYAKGFYEQYLDLEKFKRFIIQNGKLFWGKNRDILYTPYELYTGKIN